MNPSINLAHVHVCVCLYVRACVLPHGSQKARSSYIEHWIKSEKATSAAAVGASHHGVHQLYNNYAFHFPPPPPLTSAARRKKQAISDTSSADQRFWEQFWKIKILKLYNRLKCVTVKVTVKCYLPFQTFLWDADCQTPPLPNPGSSLVPRIQAFYLWLLCLAQHQPMIKNYIDVTAVNQSGEPLETLCNSLPSQERAWKGKHLKECLISIVFEWNPKLVLSDLIPLRMHCHKSLPKKWK